MADTPKVPVAVLEYEPSGFEQNLIKHKSKLILVAVLALAGTGGYWGYKIWKETANRNAAVAFTRATTVAELKAVAEKYSGQPAGGDALIFAADRLSAERPGEAIDLLKDFLNKYPEHPLRGLASFRIAEYYVLSGDSGSAEKEYDSVAKAGNSFSALAQLRLGDMKWAAGDTAKAQEYYDAIQRSPSVAAGSVRPIAKDRLEKEIKAKPPVLIDYVPEPTAAVPPVPDFGSNIDLNNLNGDPDSPDAPLLPPANPPVVKPAPVKPSTPPPGAKPAPPVIPGATPKPAVTPAPAPGNQPKPTAAPKPPVAPAPAPKPPATAVPPASGDAPKPAPTAPPVVPSEAPKTATPAAPPADAAKPAPGGTPPDGKKDQ
jgi:predicted negative regulator of RcsB-dependent stress response